VFHLISAYFRMRFFCGCHVLLELTYSSLRLRFVLTRKDDQLMWLIALPIRIFARACMWKIECHWSRITPHINQVSASLAHFSPHMEDHRSSIIDHRSSIIDHRSSIISLGNFDRIRCRGMTCRIVRKQKQELAKTTTFDRRRTHIEE